jgi:CheY-like chemotaxis protein
MSTSSRQILVVDDESDIRAMIRQVLGRVGELEVHEAASKQDAITMLEQQDSVDPKFCDER